MMGWGSIRQWLPNLVRVATLLWLVGHFALTVAYVMPLNPVTLSIQPLLNATIGTYFEQNWSVFAPNPRSSDSVLLARPLSHAEMAAVPAQGLPTDGWYDMSTPLRAGFHQNRFSAYERLTYPERRAVLWYVNGGLELTPWSESCRRGDSASCEFYEEHLKMARSKAGRLLAKVGSAFSKDIAQPGQDISHVALRVRETRSVPWSERYTAEPVVRDFELGVYPIDHSVATPGLYLVEHSQ
jgi:hypothetical protein